MNQKKELERLFNPDNWSADGRQVLGALLIGPVKDCAAKAGIPEDKITEGFAHNCLERLASVSLLAARHSALKENQPPKDLTCYGLGLFVLGLFVIDQASVQGIPDDQITEEFAEQVRQHVLTLEASSAKDVALEKALHKAANGDFIAAGKLLRELLLQGGHDKVKEKYAVIGLQRIAQCSDFGKRGIESRTALSNKNRQIVLDAAKEILSDRKRKPSDRKLASLVSKKTDINFHTVRGHIRNLKNDKKY